MDSPLMAFDCKYNLYVPLEFVIEIEILSKTTAAYFNHYIHFNDFNLAKTLKKETYQAYWD